MEYDDGFFFAPINHCSQCAKRMEHETCDDDLAPSCDYPGCTDKVNHHFHFSQIQNPNEWGNKE